MAKKDKEFRLCYVRDNVLYFTDNFAYQWGDDWDDAPYQCNAGEPYGWSDNGSKYSGHIRHIGIYVGYADIREAWGNGSYSVEEVNKKVVPWLYSKEAGGLMAGATMDEAVEWCRKSKVKFGELTE